MPSLYPSQATFTTVRGITNPIRTSGNHTTYLFCEDYLDAHKATSRLSFCYECSMPSDAEGTSPSRLLYLYVLGPSLLVAPRRARELLLFQPSPPLVPIICCCRVTHVTDLLLPVSTSNSHRSPAFANPFCCCFTLGLSFPLFQCLLRLVLYFPLPPFPPFPRVCSDSPLVITWQHHVSGIYRIETISLHVCSGPQQTP